MGRMDVTKQYELVSGVENCSWHALAQIDAITVPSATVIFLSAFSICINGNI